MQQTCRFSKPESDTRWNVARFLTCNSVCRRWKKMKEKNGLKLLPEKEVYRRRGELFDDGKFDRINKIMTRWANNFKAINRNFEVQRSFRDGRRVRQQSLPWTCTWKHITTNFRANSNCWSQEKTFRKWCVDRKGNCLHKHDHCRCTSLTESGKLIWNE